MQEGRNQGQLISRPEEGQATASPSSLLAKQPAGHTHGHRVTHAGCAFAAHVPIYDNEILVHHIPHP
jgi:hypothetical protein